MRGRGIVGGLIIISLVVALAVASPGIHNRELIDVTLLQTLGVDGPGPVTLTAVAPSEGEEPPQRYRTQGDSLSQAREKLRELGKTRLEVTHVAQLVLGPDVAVERTLWEELHDRASGCDARVWLSDRPAQELLAGVYEPCLRLRALEENGPTKAPTLLEALSAMTREGQVTLPVLALEGEDLAVVGTRTIKEA